MTGKRKLMLIVSLICFSFIMTSCTFEMGSMGTSFEKELRNGNYLKAIEIYENDIYGNAQKENEAASFMQNYLQEEVDKFATGELEESECKSAIDTCQRVNEDIQIVSSDFIEEKTEDFSIISESRSSYNIGSQALEQEDYETAIVNLSAVEELDVADYQNAQGKIKEATTQYLTTIKETIQEHMNKEEYEIAVSLIEDAEEILGDNNELEVLKSEIMTKAALELLNSYIAEKDYAHVFSYYQEMEKDGGIEIPAEVSEQVESIKTEYRNNIIKEAFNAYQEKGNNEAVGVINKGLSELTNDEKLISIKEVYSNSIKEVKELQVIDEESVKDGDGIEDRYGNAYKQYYEINSVNDGGTTQRNDYITFYTNGQYTNFTGNIFPITTLDADFSIDFIVYGDNTELYRKTLTKTSKTESFDIDISGIEQLKIEAYSSDWYMPSPGLIMAESYVSKTLGENDVK